MLVLAVKYVVLPNVEGYQGDIISRVAAATEMDVSASAIRSGWSGFRPYVELENVVFRETASSNAPERVAGAEALKLPRLTASLSWWSLLLGQIRFVDVNLEGPELALSRRKDGLLYFAGRALNTAGPEQDDGRLVEWLLEQSDLEIQRATLAWTDELSPGETLLFTDLGLHIEKGVNGHVFGLIATPPVALARKIDLRGTLRLQKNNGRWKAIGSIYADATDTNFAEIRRHLPALDTVQSGLGNARAWIDIDNTLERPDADPAGQYSTSAGAESNPFRVITADLNLVNARAQLSPEAAPLNIAKLAARIDYKAQESGFSVAIKTAEFRTREGVTLPPADFSLTLLHQSDPATAKGEITGSGIDLSAMTALLQYLPVGRDPRAAAARFNPRGVLGKSSFAWTGDLEKPAPLSTYRIKAAVADFTVNADGNIPGVSGFTGTVEGDEGGGKFTVASRNLQLDAPHIMRAPRRFDSLDGDGSWIMTAESVDVDIRRVAFANPDVAGEFSGRYSRHRADGPKAKEEKGPGSLNIKGKLTRAKALAVANYLPNAASQTRDYIEWAVRDGEIASADFALKGEIFEFPFRNGKGGNFRIAAKVKDVDFRYAAGWPTAESVNGELVFQNTGFTAKIESGQFFGAQVKATTIAIDDFAARPYLLSIQGEADARGEDVARFMRESPLINGVGAFVKSVAIEGPGLLELQMKIPISAPDPSKTLAKINGKYTLRRGQAKPVVGPLVTALSGSVAFSESGVKSNGITGTAYGNPLTLSIINAADGGVVTEFAGRADVSQMGDVLPFQMPQQVTGLTDFNGRITTREGGAEITIDSSLLGVTSSLPAPLVKRSDEVRKLRLTIANTGQVSEKISLTMAGAATDAATAQTSADAPASRIDARFQRRFDTNGIALGLRGGVISVGIAVTDAPVPEGLWFAGAMPLLDFDLWRQAFENFYPPVVAKSAEATTRADGNSRIEIAGFDFKLGGLVAYGRPFDAMMLKGRHSGQDWRLTVDSDDAVGDISWRAGAFKDRGAVRARLQKLVVADEVPPPKGSAALPVLSDAGRIADFPALDIIAEKFTYKNRELGKLELRATPMGDNWRVDQLSISIGHAKMEMDGLWQRYGDPQRPPGSTGKSLTTMNLKLDTSNLNALFNQFGFGDYVKGGQAKLDGQLSWPGHIYQFQTAALSGNFKVNASDGRFAKIEPGAGKLLGLMSLQSLPRRITLDFRDIFSEGLAFSKIDGDIKITSGIMSTENFEIKGPAAYIKTSGEVSLPTETVNLKMKVTPLVGDGAALGAAVFLTPVVGAVVYAGSKLLQGVLSYELSVTGPWDNPQSEQIKRNAPAAPTTPSADTVNKTP